MKALHYVAKASGMRKVPPIGTQGIDSACEVLRSLATLLKLHVLTYLLAPAGNLDPQLRDEVTMSSTHLKELGGHHRQVRGDIVGAEVPEPRSDDGTEGLWVPVVRVL